MGWYFYQTPSDRRSVKTRDSGEGKGKMKTKDSFSMGVRGAYLSTTVLARAPRLRY